MIVDTVDVTCILFLKNFSIDNPQNIFSCRVELFPVGYFWNVLINLKGWYLFFFCFVFSLLLNDVFYLYCIWPVLIFNGFWDRSSVYGYDRSLNAYQILLINDILPLLKMNQIAFFFLYTEKCCAFFTHEAWFKTVDCNSCDTCRHCILKRINLFFFFLNSFEAQTIGIK